MLKLIDFYVFYRSKRTSHIVAVLRHSTRWGDVGQKGYIQYSKLFTNIRKCLWSLKKWIHKPQHALLHYSEDIWSTGERMSVDSQWQKVVLTVPSLLRRSRGPRWRMQRRRRCGRPTQMSLWPQRHPPPTSPPSTPTPHDWHAGNTPPPLSDFSSSLRWMTEELKPKR